MLGRVVRIGAIPWMELTALAGNRGTSMSHRELRGKAGAEKSTLSAKALLPTRRQIFKILAAAGIGSAVFRRALAVQVAQTPTLTVEMIQQAEWISGLKLTDAERKAILGSLSRSLRGFEAMRA